MANRDTGGGANIEGDVRAGQNVTGRDDNRRYGASDVDRELSRISSDVARHSQQILELIIKMDDLPGRVRDLEKTEVVIRPRPNAEPEIIYRPAPNVTNLSMRTLMIVLVTALIIVIALVAFLVYFTVRNG